MSAIGVCSSGDRRDEGECHVRSGLRCVRNRCATGELLKQLACTAKKAKTTPSTLTFAGTFIPYDNFQKGNSDSAGRRGFPVLD